MEHITLQIKPLTKLWTGNGFRKSEEVILTGLIGSLRWWMEVIVRGLGGFACDPTSPDTCQFNTIDYKSQLQKTGLISDALESGLKGVCPVCRIFGCNGLKSSIGFQLVSEKKYINLNKEQGIILDLILRRKLEDSEKWLFQKTIDVINFYGSIGGKNPAKPYERGKNTDYGVVSIIINGGLDNAGGCMETRGWLRECCAKEPVEEYPNLRYFWFIKKNFLEKSQINELLKLRPDGTKEDILDKNDEDYYIFLRGASEDDTQSSKKIFSFKGHKSNFSIRRAWGYVRNEKDLARIRTEINGLGKNLKTGKDILREWGCKNG